MDYQSHIIREPANRGNPQRFSDAYRRAVRAVIAFAAISTEEDMPLPSVPSLYENQA